MDSLAAAAFPTLTDEQMSAVMSMSDLIRFEPEQTLIRQGEKDYPFFVIQSGAVRIVELRDGTEHPITVHGPGEFTGDVDMLTGRSAVVSAIADGPVEAYQLCARRLRKVLCECPNLSDLLLKAFQMRRRLLENSDFVGVRLIGETNTPPTSRLREFFNKNHVPHSFYEASSDPGRALLADLQTDNLELPVIHCNGTTVSNPTLPKLAECIGISRNVDGQLFDLVIVGSGPAGLSAAVYASSEGLSTLVIDSVGPGGQAGSSSRIENFIGFPAGLSGGELANRGYLQALKFGTQFTAPISVKSLEQPVPGEHHLRLCTGQTARARTVLIATGVKYRQLELPDCRRLEGAGVYYAATSVEARGCEDSTVVVVGGGNSAGQAAMFLAGTAREVKVVIRGNDLSKSMSAYLCERVLKHPRIQVVTNSETVSITGTNRVESVALRNRETGEVTQIDCSAFFTFIGATPNTEWLPAEVLRDEKGYVLTGSTIPQAELAARWKLDRPPCDLETTVPGIFAAGDVRAGTTKRCGFAVGDGSLAIACVHRLLSAL